MSAVRSKVTRGAAWMVAARACDRGLGLISTLILARLLVPEDFGMVAMAMSVAALLELLRAFGLDVVLVQHQAPERKHYDTAWTLNVLASALITVLLAGLAHPAALFFGEPELTVVMLWLAAAPLIQSLQNIGVVDFRRNLEFDRDFLLLFLSRLSRFLITVPLAFWLRDHWALVISLLLGRAIAVALSYRMHPYRPRFSLEAWEEFFHFSKWLFVRNLLQLVRNRTADLVIGRVAGTGALGLFSVSTQIAQLPASELAAPINRALLPAYARHSQDPVALRRACLEVVSIVWLCLLPMGAGIVLAADYAVPLLLGKAWAGAAPVVAALALAGMFDALGSNTGALFLAMGKPRIISIVTIVHLVVFLPALVIGVQQAGAVGAAWAAAAGAAVVIPLGYGTLAVQLKLGTGLLWAIWRPIVAGGAMVLCVQQVADRLPPVGPFGQLLLHTLAVVGTGALVYVGTIVLLWLGSRRPKGAETWLFGLGRGALRRIGVGETAG